MNETTITLRFSEALDETAAPANADFSGKTLSTNNVESNLAFSTTAPTISGDTITLTLASSSSISSATDTVRISYTKPTTNPIKDLAGEEADSFTDKPVFNEIVLAATGWAVTSTPTNSYYGNYDTITFTVSFNGRVDATGEPRFAFDLGGETRYATYTSGSNSTKLTFSYTVAEYSSVTPSTDPDDHDGISWGANALELNGGAISFTPLDTFNQVDAGLDNPAQADLPGHKVDARAPELLDPPDGITVNGTTITLTYSEALKTTPVPPTASSQARRWSWSAARAR